MRFRSLGCGVVLRAPLKDPLRALERVPLQVLGFRILWGVFYAFLYGFWGLGLRGSFEGSLHGFLYGGVASRVLFRDL